MTRLVSVGLWLFPTSLQYAGRMEASPRQRCPPFPSSSSCLRRSEWFCCSYSSSWVYSCWPVLAKGLRRHKRRAFPTSCRDAKKHTCFGAWLTSVSVQGTGGLHCQSMEKWLHRVWMTRNGTTGAETPSLNIGCQVMSPLPSATALTDMRLAACTSVTSKAVSFIEIEVTSYKIHLLLSVQL